MTNFLGLARFSFATVAVALVVGGGANLRANPNLLTNGSFEDTTNFTPNSGNDTMVLTPGDPTTDTAMTGWTDVNGPLAWIGPTNPFGIVAVDGSYSLDLTSYSDGPSNWGGIVQSVTTVDGAQYQLSFELGTIPGTASVVTASATGTAGQTFENVSSQFNNWQTYDYDFTATGSSTAIELVGAANGYDTYIGVDNVDLTLTSLPVNPTVPDAAFSAGLLALGLVAMGIVGKRRSTLV